MIGKKKTVKRRSSSSAYREAKVFFEQKRRLKHFLRDASFIIVGILSAGFGLKGFLLPNHFIDGGATGISLLISAVSNVSLSLLIVAINIPFVILGYKVIGRIFAIRTALAIVGLAIFITAIPYPIVTQDKLLVAVFGGFFLGVGIGLAVRGGCVIDGTEVLALYLNRKFSISMGDVILIINIFIFGAAAYVFSFETALYSILTYMAASKTVDFIIEGIEEYTGVTIISTKSEEMRKMIIADMGKGVTIYKGKRGFGKHGDQLGEMNIVFTVVTRLEINKLNAFVENIDPNAFVIMSSIKDIKGGMIKRRPLKE
ncbi:MAG: YitT family protein [Bacteroidetes bacterium]|nr:YitT family protein [Bacteroidota bacterium]HNR20781.1 YitT family protein [Bacteroidia bacterium]HNU34519.1 YitT family protein [Bacteroidia bacterium]